MNTLVRIYASAVSKDWDRDNLINRLRATTLIADKDEVEVIQNIIDNLPKTSPVSGTLVARIVRACTKDTSYYPSIICSQILQSYYGFNDNFIYIAPFKEFPEGIDVQFFDYPIEYNHDTANHLDDYGYDYVLKNPLKGEDLLKQYSLDGLRAFCKEWL